MVFEELGVNSVSASGSSSFCDVCNAVAEVDAAINDVTLRLSPDGDVMSCRSFFRTHMRCDAAEQKKI